MCSTRQQNFDQFLNFSRFAIILWSMPISFRVLQNRTVFVVITKIYRISAVIGASTRINVIILGFLAKVFMRGPKQRAYFGDRDSSERPCRSPRRPHEGTYDNFMFFFTNVFMRSSKWYDSTADCSSSHANCLYTCQRDLERTCFSTHKRVHTRYTAVRRCRRP